MYKQDKASFIYYKYQTQIYVIFFKKLILKKILIIATHSSLGNYLYSTEKFLNTIIPCLNKTNERQDTL